MAIRKNKATKIQFYVYDDSGDTPITGKASEITVVNLWDPYAGTPANAEATGTVVEVDSTNFPGWYEIQLSAQEMNTDMLVATPDLSGVTGTTPRAEPPSLLLFTDLDFEKNLMGDGFNTSTDSLEAIRNTMQAAASPIVRDD